MLSRVSDNPSYTSNAHVNSGSDSDYGAYYNWHAAVAEKPGTTVDGNKTYDTSICPKGWTLPTGDTGTGSWHALYNNDAYKDYAKFRTAFEPVLSGYHEGINAKWDNPRIHS